MRQTDFGGMLGSALGSVRGSVLGFGCGSVLGRVGRSASLRAMGCAWEEGITVFDTARSYGFGEAEGVLGEFLRGKREQAVVMTKFGILPQRQSALTKAAMPVVRAAMKVPGARKVLRRGGGAAAHGEFTVPGLRASLEESLRQLQTEYVDVLFLHEASPGALRQEDLWEELAKLVQAGKVRQVGLYGELSVVAAGLAAGLGMGAMQFGADAFDPVAAGFGREVLLVANHPFGGEARVARVMAALGEMAGDPTVPEGLREKLRGGDWAMVTEAIFGMALRRADALVLSMMREDHVRENVRAVEKGRFTDGELEILMERMLGTELRG